MFNPVIMSDMPIKKLMTRMIAIIIFLEDLDLCFLCVICMVGLPTDEKGNEELDWDGLDAEFVSLSWLDWGW